ncbi:Rv0909 family putative TA system antitoxin [Amycolatopsis arida]|uniref:Rv0909 family putative TA system antitoxin n=1 Tax=Amycolatopsis arida TaxID=587909 RepID=UPI00312C9DF0
MTQGLDKANEVAKSKFGQHSDKIDSATQKAKGLLNKGEGGQGEGGQPGGGQQPPPKPGPPPGR